MTRTALIKVPHTEMTTMSIHEEDVKLHGTWMENNDVISKMWVHEPSGTIFYEDVPKVNDRGLLVNPFL